MKRWKTKILAVCPITEDLLEFSGPVIPAYSFEHAVQLTQNNGLGYCEVVGELVNEINYLDRLGRLLATQKNPLLN